MTAGDSIKNAAADAKKTTDRVVDTVESKINDATEVVESKISDAAEGVESALRHAADKVHDAASHESHEKK